MYDPKRVSVLVSQTLNMLSVNLPLLESAPEPVRVRYYTVLTELSALNTALIANKEGE